jgi:hypothetical protein
MAGAVNYAEQLLDVRWQRKRLEKLSSVKWQCENCCATTKTLHVHHIHYRHGAAPWEYSNRELEALCQACHAEEHRISTVADTDLADGGKPFYVVFCLDTKSRRRILKNFAHRQDAEAAVASRARHGIKAEYMVVQA